MSEKTVLVTGIGGNLGSRLLPLLADYEVIGVDGKELQGAAPARFECIDIGQESSCRSLIELIQETKAASVVHLAFVTDPVASGVMARDRMWQINVAGTARVLEAITNVNRLLPTVTKFVFPSSVAVYGPETPGPVEEDFPHGAHTLTCAVHAKQCEAVVQKRLPSLGDCNVYVLRPHIITGASVHNYLVDSLRGTAYGEGWLGRYIRKRGIRLPILLPYGQHYAEKLFQFVHVDDVARVIHYVLRRPFQQDLAPEIFNLAGSGRPLSIAECASIANAKITRLPTRYLCRKALSFLWSTRSSTIPPDAFPYMTGSYTMKTGRLRAFVGRDYERLIQYSVEQALRDSFASETSPADQIGDAVSG